MACSWLFDVRVVDAGAGSVVGFLSLACTFCGLHFFALGMQSSNLRTSSLSFCCALDCTLLCFFALAATHKKFHIGNQWTSPADFLLLTEKLEALLNHNQIRLHLLAQATRPIPVGAREVGRELDGYSFLQLVDALLIQLHNDVFVWGKELRCGISFAVQMTLPQLNGENSAMKSIAVTTLHRSDYCHV